MVETCLSNIHIPAMTWKFFFEFCEMEMYFPSMVHSLLCLVLLLEWTNLIARSNLEVYLKPEGLCVLANLSYLEVMVVLFFPIASYSQPDL